MTGSLISAVAFCPHPPLLVPELGVGIEAGARPLRAACDQAIGRLLAVQLTQIVIVGANGPMVSLRDFAPGVCDLDDERRPLSLLVGGWLIRQQAARPVLHYVAVDHGATPPARWPEAPYATGRIGLLVMGDGSARRSEKGPGYLDERAEAFDDAVAKALGGADVAALADLDVELAQELMVAGVGAWRAVAQVPGIQRDWQGEVLYAEAPYGVMYTVATWLPA